MGLLSDYLLSSEDETLPCWAESAVAPKRKGCPCCQPSWEMGGKSGGLGRERRRPWDEGGREGRTLPSSGCGH